MDIQSKKRNSLMNTSIDFWVGCEPIGIYPEQSNNEMLDVYDKQYYIDMNAERLSVIEQEIAQLQSRLEQGTLMTHDIDQTVLLEAERIVLEEQARLTDLEQEHPQFGQALKSWLARELANRQSDDSIEGLLDKVAILEEIVAQLTEDNEDELLIEIAETHMIETIAKIDQYELERLHELAH